MVLDKEDGQLVAVAYLAYELRKLQSFLRVHASRRLIKQQQLRLSSKRAGDLKTALDAIGQASRDVILVLIQPLLREQRYGLLAHTLLLCAIEMQRCREKVLLCAHVLCNEDVFKHGELREQPDILECSRNALGGYHVRRVGHDVRVHAHILARVEFFHLALRVILGDDLAHEFDLAVRRLIYAGNAVEGRGLACAVRTDKCDNFALVHVEIQVVDGDNAAELHGDVFNMQYVFSHCLSPPFVRALQRAS